MLVKNAKLNGSDELVHILIKDGRFASISTTYDEGEETDVLDLSGALLMAPFVEPHVHLDATLTAGEPRFNESGTLFEGIEVWSHRRQTLSVEDVKKRAKKAITWQIANGIQFIRTHVDTSDPELIALRALLELREELKEFVTLQLVAFPQEGILSQPRGLELLEEALKLGADVVGAIPHFEFTREYGVKSIELMIELAKKYDVLVDVHCDEIDDEQSRFLEVLATRALEEGIGHKVTASHTTAMHSYNGAYTSKLFRLLKMSGISFVANPLVNTHLQGRFDTYPKRRGITRVKEMVEAEINVCFGHDDIFDPWYPLGTGNMLQVLHMGLHVCQMMGYSEMNASIDLISKNSAKALNIEAEYGIEVGKPANFIVLNATNPYDAIRRQVPIAYSVREGRIIATTTEPKSHVYLTEKEEVTFQK